MIPLRDDNPAQRAPIVTRVIIILNVLAFLYQLTLGDGFNEFIRDWGVVPGRLFASLTGETSLPVELSTLFTAMFLHGNWLHLIGSMWYLWIFGDNVEDRMGHGRFLVFYLLTGLIAGATHWFTSPDSTLPTVGASGAVAGVLGAYFFLFPRAQIIAVFPIFFWPLFFQVPAVLYLLFWFFSQVFAGTLSSLNPQEVGGVAVWAHVGGFLAGAILHRLFLLPRRLAPRAFQPDEYGIERAWIR